MFSNNYMYKSVILGFFIALLPINLSAGEAISLEWKIPPTGLFYKTDLSQTNTDEAFIEFDFAKLTSGDDLNKELEKEILKLKFPDDMNMVSILENTTDKRIKATSYFQNWQMPDAMLAKKDAKNKELEQFTKLMNSQPQLEGVLDNKGRIDSFYLPQSQKNLISLMYELPKQSVQVGDTWPINLFCIQMGAGFSANKAKRISRVELRDITIDENNNKIAVMQYTHTEIVQGSMLNPMNQQKISSQMTCSYIGKHEFYIDKGYWKSINGQMEIQSEGMMKSKMKQKIAMLPIAELPKGVNHK